jgi:LacI family transcriptional regulator
VRPTIKDIARMTDVSIATVSNVITNKKYVRPELKKKIQETMEYLGYEPNMAARSLKINKTFKIGVVIPDVTDPLCSEILKHIEKIISMSEYQIILYNSDGKPEKEQQISESVLLGIVDGLILVSPRTEELLMSCDYQIPTVVIGKPVSETDADISYVYADNFNGAGQIASLFLEKGYQNFVCISGPDDAQTANERLDGFQRALLNNGVEPEDLKTYHTRFDFDGCYSLVIDLLENYDPSRKKGIFVCSDIGAWGAAEAPKKKGLKIPNDIGIAGFDDNYYSRFLCPGLTTAQNPAKELGETAANVMLNKIKCGEGKADKTIVLDVKLIERESV